MLNEPISIDSVFKRPAKEYSVITNTTIIRGFLLRIKWHSLQKAFMNSRANLAVHSFSEHEVLTLCQLPGYVERDTTDLIPTYWNRVTLKGYTNTQSLCEINVMKGK